MTRFNQFNSNQFSLVVIFLTLCISTSGHAFSMQEADAPAPQPKKSLIHDGEVFSVKGKTAFIFWPEKSHRTTPQPWVMYAPTLPAYPDKHESWMHKQFLDAGIAVAGIDVGETYGSPEGKQGLTDLYVHLTTIKGFAKKPCLLGRSRGGLWVSSWAIENPKWVAGIAGIYPVFDLTTYPKIPRAAPAYGMTSDELTATLKRNNPIERAQVIANSKIPVHIIHGDIDTVVPIKENSQRMFNIYKQTGAEKLIELEVVKGQGHNFFKGFFTSQPLVDFVIKRARKGAVVPKTNLPTNVVVSKDLEYKRVGERSLKLDLYRDAGNQGKLPTVVWVHGGGWKNGSKNRCPAVWLAQHGYVVASVEYRLTHESRWPTQIEDCRDAIRYLRSNAEKLGLDASHIGVFVSSAGGHLVALLGTLDVDDTCRVQAVCDWFGPTDLLTMPANVVSADRTKADVENSNGAKLLGDAIIDVPELAKRASSFYQVSADDSPFLIMHGDQDPSVPLAQSVKLHKRLTEAGVPSKLTILEGAKHGGPEFRTAESQQTILNFFDQYLKPKN